MDPYNNNRESNQSNEESKNDQFDDNLEDDYGDDDDELSENEEEVLKYMQQQQQLAAANGQSNRISIPFMSGGAQQTPNQNQVVQIRASIPPPQTATDLQEVQDQQMHQEDALPPYMQYQEQEEFSENEDDDLIDDEDDEAEFQNDTNSIEAPYIGQQQQFQQQYYGQTSLPQQPLTIQLNIGGPMQVRTQQQPSDRPQESIRIPNFNPQPMISQPVEQYQQYQDQQQYSIPQQQMQIQIPIQQQTSQNMVGQNIVHIQQDLQPAQQQSEEKIGKKSKKKKKKKLKGKGSLMEFYDLTKIKVTLEIDPFDQRLRGQSIYVLKLKDQETINQTLEKLQEASYKKYQLDLGFHAKQVNILTVQSFEDINNRGDAEYDYPLPQDQSTFQTEAYGNISKDLHSFEFKQKLIYDQEQENPILIAKKIANLNFKKENVKEVLKPKLNILITYFLKNMTDFGIKVMQYKTQGQTQKTGQASSGDDSESTYYYTSDLYDQTQLWLPIIKGTGLQPVNWTMRYIVPSTYTVISSGTLFKKQIESNQEQRALFIYKLHDNEAVPPEKLGFVIGQFPHIHKMNDLSSNCSSGAYAFFMSSKKQETFLYNKFYEKNIFNILQYLQKLINSPFPFNSLKLVFVPNLFLKASRKQSCDFSGGLHLLDEEILFQRNQLETRFRTYKYLASSIAYDYFGGKVYEESPEDYWLLLGIRENIGNHYKIVKCGVLIYRYHIMQTIQSFYRKAKNGIERYPLKSDQQPHPSEQILNEIIYEKCELIMHMIESMIDKSYFERIIKQLYESASPTISTGLFMKIFKQVCGFKLNKFCQNWILSTSCPKLTASYNYNKKNNSLDLTITQTSAMKSYFIYKKYLKQNIDLNQLLLSPFIRSSPEYKTAIKRIDPMDKFYVELKRECMRWFTGEVNVMIYLTDGAEIQTQQQKMSLKFGKTQISVNIPLHCKVKKTIQNKKKEYENMLMFDQEIQDEVEENMSDSRGGQQHHMIDNSSWKFGLNDFELQDYPLNTKNLFEVKNLESPVLWIRVDPDMEYIRKVKVIQEKNNWLFQLLQEKDIIGQIEAIKQLYKYDQYSVLEILTSVSTNESYFFKVRKVALHYLQKMQASKLDQYWKHEKFLIKIFNQRNFDPKIGFYKSNDFTKILEYYFDKYILKTLSKCKESPLKIKEEIRELYLSLNKNQNPIQEAPLPGSISISFQGNDIISSSRNKPSLDEANIQYSSDQIAQLLLKLLQENDNSENPFDDSCYLKQILKSLGNLDNFKYMPEIAQEIYRQYRLDYIGKFSAQFAITKGAIAGYYNIRKQIFKFKKEKIINIDPLLEDVSWYENQINLTEKTLNQMDQELEMIINDRKWPLEIRFFIVRYKIKHTFFYQHNSFLKALYIHIKAIDLFQSQKKIKDAVFYTQQLVFFLEKCQDKLDYREAYLNNEKSRAIVNILWSLLCLPCNYLECSLLYWVKRLYHFIYSNEIPPFIKEQQLVMGIKMEEMKYDEYWAQVEDQVQEGQLQDNKDRHLKQILASRSAQVIVRTPKGDNRFNDFSHRNDQLDNKLKIVLGSTANRDQRNDAFGNRFQQQQQQIQPSSIKINIGGINVDAFKNQNYQNDNKSDVEMINTYQNKNDYDNEQDQQKLMQSISHQTYYGIQKQAVNYQEVDDDESIYDEFADIKFDIEWLQIIWEITGLLWYHEESAAFLNPVTQDDLGEYFDYYLRIIDYPIDLTTMKQKIREMKYNNIHEWKRDVYTMFKNCKSFNVDSSEIYRSAVKLEKFYWAKIKDYGLIDQQSTIRIS